MSEDLENEVLPERMGPYKVLRRLARGGMADLYVGLKDGEFEGPDCAVLKVWRLPSNVNPEDDVRVRDLLSRLIEEGRLGKRLAHPAIIGSYGVVRDWELDRYFLVQEYVHGMNLGHLMDYYGENDLRIPLKIVLNLTIPVLKALHYAQFEAKREDGRPLRVVHRDIKPDNVMVGYSGHVKLLDFGVARSTSFTRPVTVGNFVVGTRHYMAPEQVFDPNIVGHRTDLFSVGLILFELCTLRPAFSRSLALSEYAEALGNFRFDDYESLIDLTRYPGIREVLGKVLVSDPKQRYASAEEMAHALELLLERAPREPTLKQFMIELEAELEEAEAADTLGPNSKEAALSPSPAAHQRVDGETPGVQVAGAGMSPQKQKVEAVSLWYGEGTQSRPDSARRVPESPVPSTEERPNSPLPNAPGTGWAAPPSLEGRSNPATTGAIEAREAQEGRPPQAQATALEKSQWQLPVIVFGLILLIALAWLALS